MADTPSKKYRETIKAIIHHEDSTNEVSFPLQLCWVAKPIFWVGTPRKGLTHFGTEQSKHLYVNKSFLFFF